MPTIAPGAHIELRDAVWRVVRVDPTSTGTHAWRCVGVSELVRDREAVFLEEFDRDAVRVLDPRKTELERDTSNRHRAGLLYIEALLRDVPPTGDALHVGHRAAMDVLDFQLEPAHMALGRPRARILIADAVGLGKTLEAGILLSELIRRGRAKRILAVTTRAMLTQFQKEMWCRFSIPLVRLDSVGLQRIRTQIPTHHNPFYWFDKAIISIDTIKQDNAFRTHVENAHWDVIVIDEAHNAAPRGSQRSARNKVAALLARNCDNLLMLSATPHDGRPTSFAGLMNMLDPTAIADPEEYLPDDIRGLYARRFKAEVADQLAQRIPRRDPREIHVPATEAEEVAYDVLVKLELPGLDGRRRGGERLFRTTLEKALFSSPAACLETIDNRLGRIAASAHPAAYALDVVALQELRGTVAGIGVEDNSKLSELVRLLKEDLRWTGRKKNDRLVIFSERIATLHFLRDHLVPRLPGLKSDQVEILHGGSDIEQQRIVEEFGKENSRIRLLLASDVASEGLNLHYQCHRLVHYDVPWSLMVFQQRNGRIDRYGQTRRPQIVYLLTDSTNPKVRGDARILQVLIGKDRAAQDNIGDPSAFLGVYDVEKEEDAVAAAMEAGKTEAELAEQLDVNAINPFEMMLADGAAQRVEAPPTAELPSLFVSDFDYLVTGLSRLGETVSDLKWEHRPKDRYVELVWTPDLRRRFKKWPREIQPVDGRVMLTADAGRMQAAMEEARKEEVAWPDHQFLWRNSPVVEWLTDRLRAAFGRHTAPVLVIDAVPPGEVVVLLSGLLPNRRSQPLVHRWFAARFVAGALRQLEDFDTFLEETRLGSRDLPNYGEEPDRAALKALLPVAVDAVISRMTTERRAFVDRTQPQVEEEQRRLDRLRDRQLDWLETLYAGRSGGIAEQERGRRRREVERNFHDYRAWVVDAMTPSTEPFIQVVAVLCGMEASS